MSPLVLARLSSRRSQLVSNFVRAHAFERRAYDRVDSARWPVDFYDALTLVQRGS